MTEPIAYLNGEFLSIANAKLSIFDLGIVQGASVTEMIRTFRHQPFRLDDHLDRLFRSLHCVGFPLTMSQQEIQEIAVDVTSRNAKLIPDSHDLGIIVFVTAGLNQTYVGTQTAQNTRTASVCVHTFSLPFELWAEKCNVGQHLITPSIRHIPPDSLDPKIKSRSRLHWYLADRQARLADPKAGALVLDHAGNIAETSTGNFFVVSGKTISTPSHRTTLGGVSQQVLAELANQLGYKFQQVDIQVYDALTADEAFTSSTPYCLLPVTQLNGQTIGNGQPGPVFQKLMSAWNDLVGIDIIGQIQTGAAERSNGAASS